MDIGTGIFCSALFLGTVVLFVATKDRWNWKKIILWPLGIVVGISTIGLAGNYAYDQYNARPVPPQKQTSLWGISLQSTPADVKFAKGEPSSKEDDETWRYKVSSEGNSHDEYSVKFKDGKVRFIAYVGSPVNAPTIAHIGPRSSIEEVVSWLGEPSYISRSSDDLYRSYSFEKYNMFVAFGKLEVFAIGIYDPATGPFKFKNESK